MKTEDVFSLISPYRFFKICGYSYRTLEHAGLNDASFEDLTPKMQYGFRLLIYEIYKVQKMVYIYDIEFVNRCMIQCGIKMRCFYDGCGNGPTFYKTLSLAKDREGALIRIRMKLIAMLADMMEFAYNAK